MMRVGDTFKYRNNSIISDDEQYSEIQSKFEEATGKNLDEYTAYRWAGLEFLDSDGSLATFSKSEFPDKYSRCTSDLLAVKWDASGKVVDSLFIKLFYDPDALQMYSEVQFRSRNVRKWSNILARTKASKFRVLGSSDLKQVVGCSPSIAGHLNRNPLPQGTILSNSDWLTIITNKDGTKIENLEFHSR